MSPQRTIAHYRITVKLGEGGMGGVWRAIDTKLNRDVAIKILESLAARSRPAHALRQRSAGADVGESSNIAAIYGVEARWVPNLLRRGDVMRFAVGFCILAFSPAIFAGEPRIHRDLAYFEPKEQRRTLDVYSTTESKNQPIVFWIHGGGWQRGDKSDVAAKPWAFLDRGFVFVSTNYRFVPNVTMKQIAEDLAKAIRWTHDHAREYGGDPNTIFVMGHSAGASLAALICTDGGYLKAEGLSLTVIKGCVPVDGDAFDVPMQIKTESERGSTNTIRTFGDSVASQSDLSAVTHIARGRNIPPFLNPPCCGSRTCGKAHRVLLRDRRSVAAACEGAAGRRRTGKSPRRPSQDPRDAQ